MGDKSIKGYDIHFSQATAPGPMMVFKLGPKYDFKKFFSSLKLIKLSDSLGGIESLCRQAHTHTTEVREELT
jgi:cystathionine beta-lyase/cystathionine gamma-synthase